jgi:hypothetical protein
MKAKLVQSIASVLILTGLTSSINTYCQSQKRCTHKYLETLPADLKLEEKTPQKYLLIKDMFDYDLLGNFIKKSRISGEYTRGLKNEYSKWNNIRTSQSNNFYEPFPEGEKQEALENFTYCSALSTNLFKDSMFKKIPEPNIELRNLVWDMMGFEMYAWKYFDSLNLNQQFLIDTKNHVGELEGIGNIVTGDSRLTWNGITSINSKICAIIKFVITDSKLNFDYMQAIVKGRSNCWGFIFVSLNDKQIEYAELHEDIIMEIKIKTQDKYSKINNRTDITLKKIL